tara:strand:+ start:17093 stop:17197 length:105 start_codon:yes stop_codon:yes gene_type:complete
MTAAAFWVLYAIGSGTGLSKMGAAPKANVVVALF